MVMVYQYIGVLIGIIGIIFNLLRFREGKMSLGMLLVWNIIWILIIIISIFPRSTGEFASLTGVGRGLDLIFILGIIGCYYLIFKIYNMIENIEQEITHLVREIALQRENIESKKDEENKKIS
jgi:hypothetical protein